MRLAAVTLTNSRRCTSSGVSSSVNRSRFASISSAEPGVRDDATRPGRLERQDVEWSIDEFAGAVHDHQQQIVTVMGDAHRNADAVEGEETAAGAVLGAAVVCCPVMS